MISNQIYKTKIFKKEYYYLDFFISYFFRRYFYEMPKNKYENSVKTSKYLKKL